jgi:hypothetical protein
MLTLVLSKLGGGIIVRANITIYFKTRANTHLDFKLCKNGWGIYGNGHGHGYGPIFA